MTDHNVSYECAHCGFELWHPLWRFDTSVLGLTDDARFPGRCILVLRDHHEHLDDVPSDVFATYMTEVVTAGRAIRKAMHADRINYAALSNTDAHVHFHLIPRRAAGDPIPTKAPWAHPDPKQPLPERERRRIMNDLVRAISGAAP